MRKNYFIAILVATIFTVSFALTASSQTEDKAVSAATAAPREIAIYGEIQAVDTAAGTIDIQYYDYDSDSEKTATIIVDKESKLENANTLSDIKKGDWADVTYVINGGKNVARLIMVEKEEVQPVTEPAGEGPAAVPPGE
ncbi:MAG: hypothetical protein NC938_03400 [Candidatus Omnitrophica bacterium]|nr:hypothetical protein [Candidatus Omnitrophota bacterium]MCM8790728.1 hypothetical protein [Candidatus Omnitrophota bacterium]